MPDHNGNALRQRPTEGGLAIRLLPAILLLSAPLAAQALPPTDRFAFVIGGYANSLGLDGRFDGSGERAGTRYDFGESFELEDRRELALVGFEWSPHPRHQLHFTAFEDGRRRSASIERELVFDDVTFPLAAEVSGHFEIRALDFGYTWWAYRSERTAWGVGLGVLDYRARLTLAGTLRRDGEEEPLVDAEASVSDRLRAPVLSIGWRHVLTDRLRLRADASALQIGWDRIDGEIHHLRLAAEYFPFEHVGLSLGYALTEVQAEAQRADFRGELELQFTGVQALARIRF